MPSALTMLRLYTAARTILPKRVRCRNNHRPAATAMPVPMITNW